MLKRLRPATPPPSSSSVPLVGAESDPFHQSKRRRILPPSLDGQSRRSESMFATDNDDGEEEYDDQDDATSYPHPFNQPGSSSAAHNTEYESANTFLHDLHASHRHRLIFSPSWRPPSANLYEDKMHSSLTQPPEPPDKTDGMPGSVRRLPFEEVQSVKDRYEDTNKRLGSLFLTRRKELDQDNP